MDAEQLKGISQGVTYTSIIIAAVTGCLAWVMTKVEKVKNWQLRVMRKEIKKVFEEELEPMFMKKSECESTHKLTDSNMHYMRQDIAELKKSNDAQHQEVKSLLQTLIEGIVKHKLS